MSRLARFLIWLTHSSEKDGCILEAKLKVNEASAVIQTVCVAGSCTGLIYYPAYIHTCNITDENSKRTRVASRYLHEQHVLLLFLGFLLHRSAERCRWSQTDGGFTSACAQRWRLRSHRRSEAWPLRPRSASLPRNAAVHQNCCRNY